MLYINCYAYSPNNVARCTKSATRRKKYALHFCTTRSTFCSTRSNYPLRVVDINESHGVFYYAKMTDLFTNPSINTPCVWLMCTTRIGINSNALYKKCYALYKNATRSSFFLRVAVFVQRVSFLATRIAIYVQRVVQKCNASHSTWYVHNSLP